MWTARDEFQERWDYVRAWNKGWLNQNSIESAVKFI